MQPNDDQQSPTFSAPSPGNEPGGNSAQGYPVNQTSAGPIPTPTPTNPLSGNGPATIGSPAPMQGYGEIPGNRNKGKTVLIICLVLILLIAAGCTYFFLSAKKTSKTPSTSASTTSSSSSGTSPTHTTTANAACTSESCFAPYFKSCTPATLTATNVAGSAYYQTLGSKSSGCQMTFEYKQNPNAAWQNKPMTCNFDNSKSLDDAVSAVFNDLLSKKNSYGCTGPFVAVLRSE